MLPRPSRWPWVSRAFLALLLSVSVGACARLERLALPEVSLNDPFWAEHDPGSSIELDHSDWGRFLAAYVRTDPMGVNWVAYGAVTPEDRAALQAYLDRLYATPTPKLARPEQLAFWVNLYNARTVALILDHYPVASIRDIKFTPFAIGPWSEPLLQVQGRPLSLNDVEHGIVRPIWQDARVHYVLNCAAAGCPNLGRHEYTGRTIGRAMDEAARAYVNDRRGVHIDDRGRLIGSKIYLWFEEDFGGTPEAVLASVRRFARTELATELDRRTGFDGFAYDWSLNDDPTAVSSSNAGVTLRAP